MNKILIIDDDPSVNRVMQIFFKMKNFIAETAKNGDEGLKLLKKDNFDIVFLDLNLPDINGEEVARRIREFDKNIIIVVITGYASVKSVIKLFKIGINDYIQKPFQIDEIDFLVEKMLKNKQIEEENIKLKKNLSDIYKPENIIGKSKAIEEVHKLIIQVSQYDVNVLIQGESGTGKEMVARAIHFSSLRKDKPFYAINCGAIPSELIESELFGYRKGAFTGAVTDRKGLFEDANGSTLFLDEINELPLHLQPKLLRVLQEKSVKRIGDNKELSVDVRIISASSLDLKNEVAKKKFREDLYYRLNVFNITLPPLRERKSDIPLLIDHFIKKYSKSIKKGIKGITSDAIKKCMNYDWNGNVRELENAVQRAMVIAKGEYLKAHDFILEVLSIRDKDDDRGIDVDKMDYKNALQYYTDKIDKIYINKAMKEAKYNKKEAAKILGISERTLYYKLSRMGINFKERSSL